MAKKSQASAPSSTPAASLSIGRVLRSPKAALGALGAAAVGLIVDAIKKALEPHTEAALKHVRPLLMTPVDLWVALLPLLVAGWAIWLAFLARSTPAAAIPVETSSPPGVPPVPTPRRPRPPEIEETVRFRGLDWIATTIEGIPEQRPIPHCPLCGVEIRLRRGKQFIRDDRYQAESVARCDGEDCTFEHIEQLDEVDYLDQAERFFRAQIRKRRKPGTARDLDQGNDHA